MSNPSYPLATVKALAVTGPRRITTTAEGTALGELGMSRTDVFAAVAALSTADFYKTMPAHSAPGMMQDVYCPVVRCAKFPAGVQVYCKVQITSGRVLVVISFKEK